MFDTDVQPLVFVSGDEKRRYKQCFTGALVSSSKLHVPLRRSCRDSHPEIQVPSMHQYHVPRLSEEVRTTLTVVFRRTLSIHSNFVV